MLHVASLPTIRFASSLRCTLLIAALMALGAQGCSRTTEAQGQAPATLTSAALIDQEGQARRFAEFQGKTVVFSFFFASCPSVCPLETRALAEVQRRLAPALRSRVQFVSLTVDPERDTPERLKSFALTNGADLNSWSFVRADGPATTALTRELEVFSGPQQAQAAPAGHGTSVYLFDSRGRLMQRYAGSPLDGARLAREIEQLDDWSLKQGPALHQARL
jgi:cytochrome oxidase Cu insertion factor (SCO1/SenC/PrrC family)